MVYEYQKETIKYLTELVEKLEKLTDNRLSLRIGVIRGEVYLGEFQGYKIKMGDLHLCLNNGNVFKMVCDDGFIDEFDVFDDDSFVKFNENIFLKLNEWIDYIYIQKQEREQFHEKLNKDLNKLLKEL